MNDQKTVSVSDEGNATLNAVSSTWSYIGSISALTIVVVVSVVVFLFRGEIARFAAVGYPAVFLACLLLNCGVFGLSPSGLVAVEMSFVFNPLLTAIISGLGAGLGEATSFYVGAKTDTFIRPRYLNKFKDFGQVRTGAVVFVASLISGNLSDAIGIACGRLRRCFTGFMVGAVGAKVLKMLALVAGAHATSSYFGLLG